MHAWTVGGTSREPSEEQQEEEKQPVMVHCCRGLFLETLLDFTVTLTLRTISLKWTAFMLKLEKQSHRRLQRSRGLPFKVASQHFYSFVIVSLQRKNAAVEAKQQREASASTA